ncbi:MAG: DUF1566 domain-containing protein [Actinobacteria bacterium]|nr:DUF1566 domain-containing protein [Actinomycetota bacterium]
MKNGKRFVRVMQMFSLLLAAALPLLVPAQSLAQTCNPVQLCGDVDASGQVGATDALKVLRAAVGIQQSLVCSCSAGDGSCENDLAMCSSDLTSCGDDLAVCLEGCPAASVCGNELVEEGEDCETEDLQDKECTSLGFALGTLECSASCKFDKSGCYATRFDASGVTIKDHLTGLEWEKKTTSVGSAEDYGNPRDVDNIHSYNFASYALDRLNGSIPNYTCYASHCDWRLPTLAELQTIRFPSPDCSKAPCVIDGSFLPAQSLYYLTSTASGSSVAMLKFDFAPTINYVSKTFSGIYGPYLRAVRGGS